MDKQHQKISPDSERHLVGFVLSLALAHTGEVCARRCQRKHSREGNGPATTEQATKGLSQGWTQPRGMHPSVPDRPRAHGTPRAVTRAQPPPLLPSQKHPSCLPQPAQTGRNTTATQQCPDCCTTCINTHTNTHLYIHICVHCVHTPVYIYIHTERERERDSGQNRELKELMVKGFSQRLFQTQSVWLFLPLLPKPHPLQSGTTSFNSIIILTIWQSSWILPHSEWFYDPEDKAELECHFKYGWLSNLCFLSGLHDYPHRKHLNTDELWWDLCLALSAWAASPESVCFGSWLQGRFKTLASATTKL